VSAEDDRAVMERLAALEAEVKADADAQRARKEAALARAREQRAEQQAERDELRARQAAIVARKRAPARDDDLEELDGRDRARGGVSARGGVDELGDALALARKAHGVKQELTRPPKAGEKSWIKSGIASMALGPIGWLYAGSLREAVPASAAWVALALLASKILPVFLLMPALMVALPLSAVAGVVYALQYNRAGKRQRLFGEDKPKKQLPGGE
jgi:hypothetical protein